MKEIVVTSPRFRTHTELERQMDAARQLRAETLASASWILSSLPAAAGVIRRIVLRMTAHMPHRA